MGEQNDNSETESSSTETPPPPPASKPQMVEMTQEKFNEVDAATRRKGGAQRQKEIEADLGMSIADAKKLAAEAAKRKEAEQTEAERIAAALAEATARAEAAEARAAEVVTAAVAERKLVEAGVPAAGVSMVVPMLNLAPGADEDAIAEAITTAKTVLPALFTSATPPPANDDGSNGGEGENEDESAPPTGGGRSGVTGETHKSPKTPTPVVQGLDAGAARAKDFLAKRPDAKKFTEGLKTS